MACSSVFTTLLSRFFRLWQATATRTHFCTALEWGLGPLFFDRCEQTTLRLLRQIVKAVAAAGPGRADIADAEVCFPTVLLQGCGNRLAAVMAQFVNILPVFRHRLQKYLGIGDSRFGPIFSVGLLLGMVSVLAAGMALERLGPVTMSRCSFSGAGAMVSVAYTAGRRRGGEAKDFEAKIKAAQTAVLDPAM
ncbi:MAG: hypothetical protein N3A66_07135 [Planctomycetota bacterium]|nr:hypothetical protein [Planctomycetota bacterium]